jgi:hypothetical protein
LRILERAVDNLVVAKEWMRTLFDSRTGTGKKDFEW